MAGFSPMMEQYFEIKEQNPDCILFFRLGDFYEMFFEDAKIASEELEITLTGRDCGQEERAPMCGVPYHSCESYIARLISKGYRVAICEQTEDPSKTKGLVKREVVNIISPGTVIEDSMLDEGKNNYLCSCFLKDGIFGLCFVDASTGLLHLTELSGDDVAQRVIGELGRFSPSELLSTNSFVMPPEIIEFAETRIDCRVTEITKSAYTYEATKERILEHFKVFSLDELGLMEESASSVALGAALIYLYETRKTGLESIANIDFYNHDQYMRLDVSAMRNLELCETMRSRSRKGSLLWVLDKTKTAVGKRRLRGMVEQPLMNLGQINMRQNAVEELCNSTIQRGEIREKLSGMKDFERIMARIVFGTAGPKDLNSLAETISHLPEIRESAGKFESKVLKSIYDDMDLLEDISGRIFSTIDDEPSSLAREGNIIRKGFSEKLDILKDTLENGKNYITAVETREREETGIKTLKVRYNKVFGYYIEVTNSFKDKVPERYIRKQTLTNCERYITDELKEIEGRVLGAREMANQLEFEIFDELREYVSSQRERVFKTADAVARLDALASLAEVAIANNYIRPKINDQGKLNILEGRHPVVELISRQPFIPNDTNLDLQDNRCAIITGPNMAGKSTYMRQVALLTIMAQIGSFVPARDADISVCDAVYTRVGASDDLAAGQSTFMVEMSEVAYIMRNATSRSLIILDEVGRGTSTYDGMSIARAVLEYCVDKKKLGAKTLFATHYHELTSLENEIKGIKNYNIAVKKRGDDITFLRRIVRGGADKSYGVEVAKLSGIPETVINRAKQILKSIEKDGITVTKNDYLPEYTDQFSLSQQAANMLIEELKLTDVNTMTPIEAMRELFEIVEKAKNIN